MSEKFLFDTASVDALEPREKEWVAWDEGLAGFGVRILPSGTRSWIVSARTRRDDGKLRSRRIGIGRCADMSLDEARTEARKILGEAANDGVEEAAVERSPADGADNPASQHGGDAGDAGDRAAPGSPPDEYEVDPETGEALPFGANAGIVHDPDEDADLDDRENAPGAGRQPEEPAELAADEELVLQVVDETVRRVGRYEGKDGGEAGGEAVADAAPAQGPRDWSESGTGAGSGGGAHGEADGAGAYADVDDGESGTRNRGEEGVDKTEAAAPRSGRTGRMLDTVAGVAGKVVGRGRTPKPARREGRPLEEEQAAAAWDEPGTEPSASGEGGTAGKGGPAPSGESKLDARVETGMAVEEKVRDGNRLSDESVAGLAENLDGIRGVVDRIEAWSAKIGPQMELLSGSAAVLATDRRQDRRHVARAVLAMVVAVALGLAAGAAVQSRLEVLPQADPTMGWKDHVWEHYGEAFMECFQRARQAETGRANCTMEARAR